MKLMEALLWIVVAGAVLLGALYLWQGRLLYFPARASLAQMASDGLRAWPSADDFRGLVAEPPGSVRGTVVVIHGNAGHAGHRAHYAQALVPLGWRVLLAEYPGYGPRDGTPGEATLVADAAATLAQAHRSYGAPLVVIGESLGAGVAAAAVAKQPALVAGVLLVTPWDRLASVASHHYAWLPVRWLLRDRYDSAANLSTFDWPVVVAVAERDSIVPARFGTALHASLGKRGRLISIPDSEHNDWPERVDAAWWQEAIDLALGERPPEPSPTAK